jgi:hypothetical protein
MSYLYLHPNSTNIIGVTATEKATLDEFFFLFRFYNIQLEKDFFLQIESDNAGNPRWDRFTIIMPDDIDLPAGKYHYFVYQSEVDESEDWQDMIELENGKLEVPETQKAEISIEENDTDISIIAS